MTQKNKLIVGGVVVVLVAYYLYDRNKKMKTKADLKAGAESVKEWTPESEIGADIKLGGVKPTKAILMADAKQELEFAGSRGKGISAQYYR
jgi:hypothetical protein